jgi:hypothetical protein
MDTFFKCRFNLVLFDIIFWNFNVWKISIKIKFVTKESNLITKMEESVHRTGYCRVEMSYTGYCRVEMSYNGYCRVEMSYTGYCRVEMSNTDNCRVEMSYTV